MLENLPILPSLHEVFFDPISIILFAVYATLIIWEAKFPARVEPRIPYMEIKNSIAFITFFILSTLLPLLSDAYLSTFQLLDLSDLGTVGGAVLGIFSYELGFYFWHRMLHRNSKLWRTFHQMHHSSKRSENFGAFFFNPLEVTGFTFLGSVCLIVLAGFSAQASTIIILITTLFAIFQHSNIKTPSWIGYFIKRPESHALHYAKGEHVYNYSNLAFIDMLFGTFKNPKGKIKEVELSKRTANRFIDMLFFKDIVKE